MRILVSNDDGIQAHGIKVLERIAREFSNDVWVVAPESERSGAGHSLTIHKPLRIREVGAKKFAIVGTPTDCVMAAVNHLMKDCSPDLVLSGINHGSNLAEDITYSGTVAVAMEATLIGIKAVAFSLDINDHSAKWSTVEDYSPRILNQLISLKYPPRVFVNVNFPDLVTNSIRGVRIARQGQRSLPEEGKLITRIDPRGKPYYWITGSEGEQEGAEGTDLRAISEGFIAITPLSIDLTHSPSLSSLEKAFLFGDHK